MSGRPQAAIDTLPGFRRRFIVTPAPGAVTSALEDDFHCMGVTVHHANGVATSVEPVTYRAPWTTCPGAVATLVQTFTGAALTSFPEKAAEKSRNCTHLYDLAILAGAHANDDAPLVYDILVADPIAGERRVELRRNGETVLAWTIGETGFVEPFELLGLRLDTMGRWIATLDPKKQEEARVLRWGSMVAHGRTIPMAEQSDATKMPPSCHTFQPDVARNATRNGVIRDFNTGDARPLDGRARSKQSA